MHQKLAIGYEVKLRVVLKQDISFVTMSNKWSLFNCSWRLNLDKGYMFRG